MKLRKEFITHQSGKDNIMVATSTKIFSGIVKSNATAAFMIECLKEETTVDAIADKVLDAYEVDRETVLRDIEKVLEKLRSIGALEE